MEIVKQTSVEILKNTLAITAVDMSGANNLLAPFARNQVTNIIVNGVKYTL